MMTVDPASVRMKQRLAAKKFRINGVELAPAEKAIAWGKKIVDFRAEATVKGIGRGAGGDSRGRENGAEARKALPGGGGTGGPGGGGAGGAIGGGVQRCGVRV